MNEDVVNDLWKLEHEDLLMQDKFDEAQDFKLKHLPNRIFRYRALNDFTLGALQSLSVYMCDLESLNDPYECLCKVSNRSAEIAMFEQPDFAQKFQELFKTTITDREIKEIVESDDMLFKFNEVCYRKEILSLEDYETVQKRGRNIMPPHVIERNNDPMKICSFSERFDSMLMWSHYSDQHRGICIEYDFSSHIEVNSYLYPVVYSDDIFEFDLFQENKTKPSNQMIISNSRKAKDWHYEKEWRLIYPAVEEQNQPGYFTVPIPKAIYLGVRYNQNSDYKKFLLERLAEEFNIPLYHTSLHTTQYRIIPKTIKFVPTGDSND